MRRILLGVTSTIFLLALVCAVGCGTSNPFGTRVYSDKTVTIHENAINIHPAGVDMTEGEYESAPESEAKFADASVKMKGGGVGGSAIVTVNLNDGTEAATRTDPKTDLNANLTKNPSPGKPFKVVDR